MPPISRSRAWCWTLWTSLFFSTTSFSAADAQVVTYRFEAEVVSVQDNLAEDLAGAGGVVVGERVTGHWTYRTDTPDLDAVNPARGLYAFVQPPNQVVAQVNGIEFATDPANVQMTVDVRNDALAPGSYRDELRVVSLGNLVPTGFSAAPQFIGAVFRDQVSSPGRPPEFGAILGDTIPVTVFPAAANAQADASIGWNQSNQVYLSEFDPFGPLAGTGYSIVATLRSLEVCPSLDVAEASQASTTPIDRTVDLAESRGIVVVHYVAGTTRADLLPGGVGYPDPDPLIAWVEYRDLQLTTDLLGSLGNPWDHAFNAIVVESDATNPATALSTLDLDLLPDNGPEYGGQPAAWTLDFYDGLNLPGDLEGARAHTVLFGALGAAPIPAHARVEETVLEVDSGGRVIRKQLREVLHYADGLDHRRLDPEVDLTRGLSWDGTDFGVPVPGHYPRRPYLFHDATWVHHADLTRSEAPQFFSPHETGMLGSDQVVTIWTPAPCRIATIGTIAKNRLGIDRVTSTHTYRAGDTVEVDVRMGGVEVATGFAAFLEYDPDQLTFIGGTYSPSPFSLHIGDPITATDGQIDLDGSIAFGELPVSGSETLATLTFEVVAMPDEGELSVGFRDATPFESILSYQGESIATVARDSGPFKIDETDPVVIPTAILTFETDPGECSAVVGLPSPPVIENCEVASVVATRLDGLELDDPFPGGCPGDALTAVSWVATDCAGNSHQAVQLIEVVDNEPPVVTCSDLVVMADPGTCEALLMIPTPDVVDNCVALPTLSFVRSDDPGATLSDPFPIGVTEIEWQASDACGNTGQCTQLVEVVAVNQITLELQLPGVTLLDPIERCIEFTVRDTAGCASPSSVLVTFVGAPATGVVDLAFDCGDWIEVCAKDAQHTLHDTTPLSVSGDSLVGNDLLVLRGGDTNDDARIDIDDVFYLLAQFGQVASVGSCPWSDTSLRSADFSNDGVVGSEDYAILTASWLLETSCSCGSGASLPAAGAPNGGSGPTPGRGGGGGGGGGGAAAPAHQYPPALRARVDLDRNGVIDYRDVEIFERRHALGNDLSNHMNPSRL